MCGITAIVLRSERFGQSLQSMTNVIRHRGPDDEGFVLIGKLKLNCLGGADTPADVFFSGVPYAPQGRIGDATDWAYDVVMGHRRLAIVDLSSAGHQPLSYGDGRFWITYNGEIYNHRELRIELESLGYAFRSHSDTEVILAAYAQWGAACLDRFNGMWGFVIYDRHTRKIFAARDRFGVKPLYYWEAPDGSICFVSEIKQLTCAPGWAARVNGQRAYDFLVWGVTDHTDETLFKGVYQLQPGHLIERAIGELRPNREGRLKSDQWYTVKSKEFIGTLDEAAAKFKDLFVDAVRLRLRSDVPVGSCLSGGLDSSAIVCTMNKLFGGADVHKLQRTFSAYAEMPKLDESNWIKQVVEKTGVTSYSVTPSLREVLNDLADMTWHQDEPFGSTSIYAQWSVFRLASEQGVKVMLDGQGADEYLAGYHTFFGPRLASVLKKDGLSACLAELRMISRRHGYPASQLLAHLANQIAPNKARNLIKRWAGYTHKSPNWLNLARLGASPQDPLRDGNHYSGSIRSHSVAQLTTAGIRKLLHWEDRDSMAFSLESRVPFLDYRLVEFTLGLPDQYKIGEATTKRVLREAMKGLLPEPVRTRIDKLGFATPEFSWFVNDPDGGLRNLLQHSVASSNGLFNEKIITNLDSVRAGKARFDQVPWRAISYVAWLKRFNLYA